jgi:integrase/recombinase XerD
MRKQTHDQWTNIEDGIGKIISVYRVSLKSANMADGTKRFYGLRLEEFERFCVDNAIMHIHEIQPDLIRRFMVNLQEKGHNPGGVHGYYRVIKTFLRWFDLEFELENYKNPIRNIKAPKVPVQQIEPVELEDVKKMIEVCDPKTMPGARDRALFLFLLDTGIRAKEASNLDIEDVDALMGTVIIKNGKGGKPRTVYIGQKTRKALRAYLKFRHDKIKALWITKDGDRFTYWGMDMSMERHAKVAGVPKPGLHDFRRAFAINFLRNNPNEIFSLQRLMGHSDLQILRRYLAQTDADLHDAHMRGSPVDNGM